MEAGTAVPTKPQQPDERQLPPEIAAALRPGASAQQERGALSWFLGPTQALEYDVTVQYETPDGLAPLTLHFRQLDPGTFDKIDAAHRRGDGPFAKLDVAGYNNEIVATAGLYFEDATGNRVSLESAEFRGGVPSSALAVGLRFKNQGGLLDGIVQEIRSVSGYAPDRVGTAQRSLVESGKP